MNEPVRMGDPPSIRYGRARGDRAAHAASDAASRRTIRTTGVGGTTCARSRKGTAAGPAYKEVGPSGERGVTHRATIVIGCVQHTHSLEANADCMLAMGPGNLITELVLVGDHGSAVLILPAHRHPAGNPRAGGGADGYAREEVDPSAQICDTHLRICE